MTTMPQDWNDHAGWDSYFRDRLGQEVVWGPWERAAGSIPVEELPRIAADMKSAGWTSVWVPGCGLSPLPKLLAWLGLTVVATDVSPAAVAFQQSDRNNIDHFTAHWGPQVEGGSLVAEVHDFREDFRPNAFDLVHNVKAFQGFPAEDMRRIARVHARALKPGRRAYFDTMNVQGERRDELEQALEEGGFVVPFAELNRWYRRALNETGIPHAFILGRPMIPRTGEYADDQPRWERDMARLREVTVEYQARAKNEQEKEQARIGPDAKVAIVIYSTG
jgi:SAM-dependent methyltransferase